MEFRSLASYSPRSGNSFLLWHDNGIEPCIKDRFPQLHSFSRKRKGSIRHFLDGELNKILSLPLSVQASNQIISLMELLEERNWDLSINNKWTYTWNSKMFSVKKTYCLLQGTQEASPLFFLAMVFRQPWKTSVLLLALTQR